MTSLLDTFVIGDVHGRADLLSATMTAIGSNTAVPYRVVFLGDIIDRGPNSKECLDLVARELDREPGSVLLRGNHEDLMLRFVTPGAEKQGSWLMNGGAQALASYGYRYEDSLYLDSSGKIAIDEAFCNNFQSEHSEHFAMLRRAPDYVVLGDYILVHAAIDPDRPLDQQDPYYMKWTKDVADYRRLGNKIVVYGHVPTASQRPEIFSNRIALDTGACETDRLSTLHIHDQGAALKYYGTRRDQNNCILFERVEPLDLRGHSTSLEMSAA